MGCVALRANNTHPAGAGLPMDPEAHLLLGHLESQKTSQIPTLLVERASGV